MRTDSKRVKISDIQCLACRCVPAGQSRLKERNLMKFIEKLSVILTALRFWWAYRKFDNAPKDKAEGEFAKD